MANKGAVQLGPWGGAGGSAWIYYPADCAITKITLTYGEVVDSISFQSINKSNGTNELSETFGRGGGQGTGEVVINYPEEYLTLISGTTKQFRGHLVVESLSFYTNEKTYGPYGHTTGAAFAIPMEGAEIVGFFGRAGDDVNAIGIYVKPSTT